MTTQPNQTSSSMTSALAVSTAAGALVSASSPSTPASLAMNVASVKMHVPVVLDLAKSNYAKWRMLVSVLLGKYELSDHVAVQTPVADRTAEWNREDFIVRSWLYGSISEEILDIVMAENQTAHDVYLLIRNLFLDNQMTRAVHLEAEFRALAQGDLSITAYCHRLKALSDALCDVGQPVTNQTLVLTCMRGLNARFSDITTLVTVQRPLPSFLQTRSLLLLHETQLQHASPIQQQTALYGSGSNAGHGGYGYGQTSGSGQAAGYGQQSGGNNNGGHYRGKKKNPGGNAGNYSGVNSGGGNAGNYSGGGGSGYRSNDPRPNHVGPWVCFNPATGAAQQMPATWRPAGGPGLLGPRPPAPPAPPAPRPPSYGPAPYYGPPHLPPQQAYTTMLAPLHG
jgi:hypothetical protein